VSAYLGISNGIEITFTSSDSTSTPSQMELFDESTNDNYSLSVRRCTFPTPIEHIPQ